MYVCIIYKTRHYPSTVPVGSKESRTSISFVCTWILFPVRYWFCCRHTFVHESRALDRRIPVNEIHRC